MKSIPGIFELPLTPLLAARQEGKSVTLREVLAHARQIRATNEVLLIEGAGGLLSPLGEGFNARDVMASLRAIPIVVCANRLGAINQTLLVMAALSRVSAERDFRRAQASGEVRVSHERGPIRAMGKVVLMSPAHPDSSSRSNPAIIAEIIGTDRVHLFPWLSAAERKAGTSISPRIRRILDALWQG